MGFLMNDILKLIRLLMRKTKIFFVSLILLIVLIIETGCVKMIMLDDAKVNQEGIFMYGRIPERDFNYNFELGDSLELLWQSSTRGSFSNNSITIYDEYIFVSELSGRIYCFDLITGKELGAETAAGELRVAPIINNRRLFFVCNELNEKYATLYFFDFARSKYLNEIKFYGGISNELIKADKGVIILSDLGDLSKVNFQGELEWSISTNTETFVDPAMSDSIIVFGNQNGEVIGASSKNGRIIYKIKISESFESGVTIKNDKIFIGDSEGIVYCLNLLDGSKIWDFNTHSKILSTPVLNENNLFISNLAGKVFSLDQTSGRLLWVIDTDGTFNTTPALSNDYLIQPDMRNLVHLIDVNDGKIIKEMKFDGRMKHTPVFYNDVIYFGGDKAQLYAYKIVR
jgi:outer membrane protein assembly factor BamB